MNDKLTPVQFEVIRHIAQAPKERAQAFVKFGFNIRTARDNQTQLVINTKVLNTREPLGLIVRSGNWNVRLTDAGLQYCIEQGLIAAPVPTSEPDADIIATQAAEDILAEDELARAESAQPDMSVQAAVIAQPTEARERIHATPEQLQRMANLMVAIKSTETWRESFYAKHARWYDGRLDATYQQAATMLAELESIKAEQARNPIKPPFVYGYRADTRLSKRAHDDLFMLTMQLRAFCKKHGLDYEFHKRDMVQRASQCNREGWTITWQHLNEAESVAFTRMVEAFMSQALEVE